KSVHKSGVEALKKRFLGSNYVKVGKDKWRNKSGNRQFRAKKADFNGLHGSPHVHLEYLKKIKGGYLVRRNYHMPYKK
ncbi:hypothetical protein, partial [Paraclostridium dentum]|uniref:hypothetical protein n=1 Tax=Paraclostridium dentum TaxID=2662455 RepID=UPI003F41A355